MTQTIASTLTALKNVGKALVTIPLNEAVYPPEMVRRAVLSHGGCFVLDVERKLTIQEAGIDTWSSFRELSQELLHAAIQAE